MCLPSELSLSSLSVSNISPPAEGVLELRVEQIKGLMISDWLLCWSPKGTLYFRLTGLDEVMVMWEETHPPPLFPPPSPPPP